MYKVLCSISCHCWGGQVGPCHCGQQWKLYRLCPPPLQGLHSQRSPLVSSEYRHLHVYRLLHRTLSAPGGRGEQISQEELHTREPGLRARICPLAVIILSCITLFIIVNLSEVDWAGFFEALAPPQEVTLWLRWTRWGASLALALIFNLASLPVLLHNPDGLFLQPIKSGCLLLENNHIRKILSVLMGSLCFTHYLNYGCELVKGSSSYI